MAKEIGERLTHLVLSDNKLVGIPQVIAALAVIIKILNYIKQISTFFYYYFEKQSVFLNACYA